MGSIGATRRAAITAEAMSPTGDMASAGEDGDGRRGEGPTEYRGAEESGDAEARAEALAASAGEEGSLAWVPGPQFRSC